MEVAVLVHLETISETTARHFQSDVLDSLELLLDSLVILRQIAQCSQYLQSLSLAALEHQPTWTLRKTGDHDENEQGQNNLESNREAPGDAARFEEREPQIEPVAKHDTEDNHRSFNHDHLTSAMRFRCFRLPCGNCTRVHAVSETGDPSSDNKLCKTVR